LLLIIINHHQQPPSCYVVVKHYSADAAPPKVEVFVNDQRLLVDPGTTILQVGYGRNPLVTGFVWPKFVIKAGTRI
jgi:hypothetical protein